MKRSQINNAITLAKQRLSDYKITLPEFAYWTADEWKQQSDKLTRIRKRMLGWDVTDFGSDDFEHCGAVLFTVPKTVHPMQKSIYYFSMKPNRKFRYTITLIKPRTS